MSSATQPLPSLPTALMPMASPPTTPPPSTSQHRRRACAALIGLGLLTLLTACAAGANPATNQGPEAAGFLLGLWQGFIAPIAFIVSLFNSSVGIYEVNNNGGWYNFGYLIGVSIFFGGSGVGARSVKK